MPPPPLFGATIKGNNRRHSYSFLRHGSLNVGTYSTEYSKVGFISIQIYVPSTFIAYCASEFEIVFRGFIF